MITVILVVTILFSAVILTMVTALLTGKLKENWPSTNGKQASVELPMELLEKLLLRGLGLEQIPVPSANSEDYNFKEQADLERPLWQTEEMLAVPRLEEQLRMEQELLDRRIIRYQNQLSMTDEEYKDQAERDLLSEFAARDSTPQSPSIPEHLSYDE